VGSLELEKVCSCKHEGDKQNRIDLPLIPDEKIAALEVVIRKRDMLIIVIIALFSMPLRKFIL
jgi:hypothetical protein